MDAQTKLLESYILGAWFIKIRLVSSRRQLWAPETSIIHLENAALQLRKICEMLAYLCIAAAGIEGFKAPRSLKGYQVGNVIRHLNKNGALKFPQLARLEKNDDPNSMADWTLNINSPTEADMQRVELIHERTHRVLHEMSPFAEFFNLEDQKVSLAHGLNAIRSDHQWLWNRLWQHAVTLNEAIFFINLGDNFNSDRPQIIKHEKLHPGELTVNFDPDWLADFTGSINWTEFDN